MKVQEMPTKQPRSFSMSRTGTDAVGNTIVTQSKSWTNYYTLKANGKPDTSAENQHTRRSLTLKSKTQLAGAGGAYHPWVDCGNYRGYYQGSFANAENKAYSRFRKTIYDGKAELGVSLGGLKQTLSMVRGRTIGLAEALDRANRRILSDRELRKKIEKRGLLARDVLSTWSHDGRSITTSVNRKIIGARANALNPGWTLPNHAGRFTGGAANGLLEFKFGWQPLFEDVDALFNTVIPKAIPDSRITASGSTFHEFSMKDPGPYSALDVSMIEKLRVKYIAHVAVSNPNLWLANRAGLINLQTVAWDLVPWSWVVGMFGNVTQMLNSMTDFYGLTMTQQLLVRHRKGTIVLHQHSGPYSTYPPFGAHGGTTIGRWVFDDKDSLVNTPLRPNFQVRVPELNLDLALTAAALAAQRMKKISKLFGL